MPAKSSPSTTSEGLLLLLLPLPLLLLFPLVYPSVGAAVTSGRGLLERSLQYSSFQNVFFSTGGGTLRSAAIGLGGILISGRKPSGGGSKRCGVGDLRAVAGEPGALRRPVGGASVLGCWGGGGGGAAAAAADVPFLPVCPRGCGGGGGGSTWKGMPMAAAPIALAAPPPGDCGWAGLFCWDAPVAPSDWALRARRLAIRSDRIWERSMPPGV